MNHKIYKGITAQSISKAVIIRLPDLAGMTVTELKEYASEKNIKLEPKLKKAEIISVIKEKLNVE